MRSLVLAADAQSGAGAGDSASDRVLPVEAAGSEGDPQWHAGDDPSVEEACVCGGCTNVSNRATAQ
jgi:hypothetical protein